MAGRIATTEHPIEEIAEINIFADLGYFKQKIYYKPQKCLLNIDLYGILEVIEQKYGENRNAC